MINIEPITNLADVAMSRNALIAFQMVQAYTCRHNLAVWAGTALRDTDGVASHMLALGVRGLPTPGRTYGRRDDPFWYIREAVGGRRVSPIPVTQAQALRMIMVLNDAATDECPAPDLLALAGWSALLEHNYDVRAAVESRGAPTHRLANARKRFLHTSSRIAA